MSLSRHATTTVTALFALAGPVSALELQAPAGFQVEVYAADVENARQMALGDRGTLFVGSRRAGKVHALVDVDADGRADRRYLIAQGLNMPSGVAFRDGALYVAAVNRILRYDDIESRLSAPPEPAVVVDDLPDDAHHGWKAIEFDAEGFLFVPVGVPCNVCISEDERHGTILRLDVKTGRYTIYATGVRNSVGLAFHPVDHALWFTDNGRDWMGDDLPPDEINRQHRAGLDFGFPYLHGSATLDPQYGEHAEVEDYTLPVVELGAHVAPLGLMFYTGEQFPPVYRNSLLVAEHGSWNRSEKTGYRVIHVQLDGNRVVRVSPFITGWLRGQTTLGRPVDLLQLPDGSVLISDDHADTIYRVSWTGDGKTP